MHYDKQCTFLKNIKGFLVMTQKLLIKCMLGVAVGLSSLMTYAATIEGYWQSIDDHTGEKLSIIEIKKDANNEYNGTIVQRFAVPGAQMMTHCTKCTGALKNKPIVGLEILTGFKKDPNKPNAYIDGRCVDPKNGRLYKSKANLSSDGKSLRMRGYLGISALGRTVVWIRTDKVTP